MSVADVMMLTISLIAALRERRESRSGGYGVLTRQIEEGIVMGEVAGSKKAGREAELLSDADLHTLGD